MKKPQRWEVQVTNRHGTTYWQRLPANKKPQMDTGKLYRVAGTKPLDASVEEKKGYADIGLQVFDAAHAAAQDAAGVSAKEKGEVLKYSLTDDLTIRGNINKLLDVLRCLRESDMLSADGYGYAQDMVRLDMTGREAGEIVAALREALA